jgi:hypothetical protein
MKDFWDRTSEFYAISQSHWTHWQSLCFHADLCLFALIFLFVRCSTSHLHTSTSTNDKQIPTVRGMVLSPWVNAAIGYVHQFPVMWEPCWMAQCLLSMSSFCYLFPIDILSCLLFCVRSAIGYVLSISRSVGTMLNGAVSLLCFIVVIISFAHRS